MIYFGHSALKIRNCEQSNHRLKQSLNLNLNTEDFEYDPDLETYDEIYNNDKLLFFEVKEGVYLTVDKIEHNEKNAIYYFENKIADSLEEFIHKILENQISSMNINMGKNENQLCDFN